MEDYIIKKNHSPVVGLTMKVKSLENDINSHIKYVFYHDGKVSV